MLVVQAQTTDGSALATSDVRWLVVATAVTVLLAGGVVIIGRSMLRSKEDLGLSLIRSWIAIALVSGLLLFCGASFALGDTALRSSLFGGLVASVGAAVAFYFASKDSDQARKDILDATFGTVQVPDLTSKSIADAQTLMSQGGLALKILPPNATGLIVSQDIAAGSNVRNGTVISVNA